MQRFSQFQRRGAGLALLLLRGSVGALLVINGPGGGISADFDLAGILQLAFGAILCLGIFTPFVGAAAILNEIYRMCATRSYPATEIIKVLLCLVVILLGAGAYSIDGLLYGRKRIVL